MTDAISVDTLQKTQKSLYKNYLKAQKALHEAKAEDAIHDAALEKFNNKYGRVLQMMKED